MKGLIKSVARGLGKTSRRLRRHALSPYAAKALDAARSSAQVSQLLLAQRYREAAAGGGPLPGFRDAEFRAFSQYGEDGILLLLFAALGSGGRRVVEVCAGDGVECNAANLIVHHGWEGLLVDGNTAALARGAEFYRESEDTALLPPTLLHAWVTAENVNDLVAAHGFGGAIDLLSLDMDGVDYWVWKALTAASPRVVVLEYNNLWGADEPMTVRYAPRFVSTGAQGASLAAFAKLGKEKGYRLVGCHRYGFNAFFLRDDVGPSLFPEVSVASCLDNAFTRLVRARTTARDHPDWVAV